MSMRTTHPAIRCHALVSRKGTAPAQCARRKIDLTTELCLQHATLARRGVAIRRVTDKSTGDAE